MPGGTYDGRGINMVLPDVWYANTSPERHRQHAQWLRDGNFNLVHMWGGAPVAGQDAFYDACDELGILVWHEFPLAGTTYSEERPYLDLLDREARSLVQRMRRHPSTALWCGGNELIIWNRNSDQGLAFRVLNRAAFEHDPLTPYAESSPFYGASHGPYHYDGMWGIRTSQRTAYLEFGVPGTPSAALLNRFLPAGEVFPPQEGGAWSYHKGLQAFGEHSWLQRPTLEKALPPARNLDELVAASQATQTAGLQFAYEEARRQWPVCSMALAWVFNEPWPCAANNSLIAWVAVIGRPDLDSQYTIFVRSPPAR